MNGDASDPKAVRAEFADAAQFVLQDYGDCALNSSEPEARPTQ
jgi:hypothetical protein